MKILFLTPQLPYPPRQGAQIRNYHILRSAAMAHRVDLLSFARPGESLDPGRCDPGRCSARAVVHSRHSREGGNPHGPLDSRLRGNDDAECFRGRDGDGGSRENDGVEGGTRPIQPELSPLRALCGQIRLLPTPTRSRWARVRALATSPDPDVAQRLLSRGFAATLRSMAASGSYDAIQVEGLEMARYIPIAREAAPEAAIVYDAHNAEHLLQARAALVDAGHLPSWPRAFYSLIQWLKLRRYEARVCAEVDLALAVSEADAAALRALGISTPIRVVPNAIDTEYYRPGATPPSAGIGQGEDAAPPSGRGQPELVPPGSPTLLFTGTMDFRPNVDAVTWFVSSIFPAILARRPDARFLIVGRSPTRAVLRLAEANPSVAVTGQVEDVRPYFRRGDIFVVPIRMAGGARLKILEALAMGLPVVSTMVGAEGIGLVAGKEIVLAEEPEQFASAALRLLDDRRLRGQLALAGRRAAEERFDWTKAAPRLLEAYRDLRTGRRGNAP